MTKKSFKLVFRWSKAKGKGYPLTYDFTTEEHRTKFINNSDIEIIEVK